MKANTFSQTWTIPHPLRLDIFTTPQLACHSALLERLQACERSPVTAFVYSLPCRTPTGKRQCGPISRYLQNTGQRGTENCLLLVISQ